MNSKDKKQAGFEKNLSKNLQKLLTHYGVNMTQLHKSTGVPLTNINRMVNMENANPTISSLLPIANYFSITINQLIGIDPLPTELAMNNSSSKTKKWTNLPIINWEQAVEWPNVILKSDETKFVPTDIEVGENSYALIVEEENWENILLNSVLIIDPNLIPEHRDFAVVHKKGQNKANFRQVLIDEDFTYLRPLNSDFKTTVFDKNYQFLGVLVQIRIDFKHY